MKQPLVRRYQTFARQRRDGTRLNRQESRSLFRCYKGFMGHNKMVPIISGTHKPGRWRGSFLTPSGIRDKTELPNAVHAAINPAVCSKTIGGGESL